MPRPFHPWSCERKRGPVRFLTGAVVALAIVLTAFEWRTSAPAVPIVLSGPLEDNWVVEILRPVTVRSEGIAVAAVRPQRNTQGRIVPVRDAHAIEGPMPEPDHAAAEGSVDVRPIMDDTSATFIKPFERVKELRPCHRDCTSLPEELREACTERKLHDHLARNLELPRGLPRDLRTTVTFTVDADGRVGRVVCAPKVPADVDRAITRLLQAMPVMEPGRQGDMPVPVHYQIALSLRTQ